jgi:hypothetical protein
VLLGNLGRMASQADIVQTSSTTIRYLILLQVFSVRKRYYKQHKNPSKKM